MNFAVGVFELFTYTIPGSLYLAFLGYVVVRADWVDPAAVRSVPSLVLVIVAVLLSYLIGYLAYPLGEWVNRMVPNRHKRSTEDRFLERVPAARGRAYVGADRHLLLSAVQLHDKEVALEVTRLRATGLMLRNSAPPVALGLLAAVVELFVGTRPGLAAMLGVLFAAGPVVLIVQGRRFGRWAGNKTLELCFWLPDIDDKFTGQPDR